MEFRPMITPKEILRKGIFWGIYFAELVDHKDFPKDYSDWFQKKGCKDHTL